MASSGRKKRSEIKPEFIIRVPPQPASRRISEVQQVQLDIIERTKFNAFDGQKISRLLKENRDLWRAVLMPLDLISLRDMSEGSWHADTLYIYADDGCQYRLEELVREQFNADEVQWIGSSEAEDILGTAEVEGRSQVILLVWWD
jgi:hypothetical protein